ncbi:MAG TPA: EAL domain-containing protein [Polyangiaceae bacterium]|nr:EAL domain-containing protein [Polyangiaceae bacterium]
MKKSATCAGDESFALENALSPVSNRLSRAPSSRGFSAVNEVNFFGSFITPDSLSTVFQPIVNLDGGEIFAYEALVRCDAPRFSPSVLFERAATARTTGRLGRMIREIAVSLCHGRPLFVNLHPAELAEGWLVRPDDPIFSHDDEIYLEITESAPLSHFELCVDVLREVCGRPGVHLVIDDLGAGYSNIKLIADLEPKIVKLDRSLVQHIDRKPRQQKLVSVVVHLCQQMGATVVAEGIETHDEFSAVCDSGAQYGQGFLFARPSFPAPGISWPPSAEELPPTTRPGPVVTRRA